MNDPRPGAAMRPLEKLTVRGLKSIRDVTALEIGALNVLIGANGAGKSNLIGLFRLLNELSEGRLQLFVAKGGGADAFLRLGRTHTPRIEVDVQFGLYRYGFVLEPTVDSRLVFSREYLEQRGEVTQTIELGAGHFEARLREADGEIAANIRPALQSWRVFHFHDTGETATVKRLHGLNDNQALRSDAANLGAFLLAVRHASGNAFASIRDAVRLVMPMFDDFLLRPNVLDPQMIQLEWRERGADYPFLAHHLSDGTLRFMCLATLLLQPCPPTTIVIDEPELGLHPYAVNLLAAMLRSAATRTQIILATQSVALLDHFAPDEVVVVDRFEGASRFRRLDTQQLGPWLDDYSLGELWEKSIIGGRPSR